MSKLEGYSDFINENMKISVKRKLRDAVHDIVINNLDYGQEMKIKDLVQKLKSEYNINLTDKIMLQIIKNWYTHSDYSIFKESDKKWLDPWTFRETIERKKLKKEKPLGKSRKKIEEEENRKKTTTSNSIWNWSGGYHGGYDEYDYGYGTRSRYKKTITTTTTTDPYDNVNKVTIEDKIYIKVKSSSELEEGDRVYNIYEKKYANVIESGGNFVELKYDGHYHKTTIYFTQIKKLYKLQTKDDIIEEGDIITIGDKKYKKAGSNDLEKGDIIYRKKQKQVGEIIRIMYDSEYYVNVKKGNSVVGVQFNLVDVFNGNIYKEVKSEEKSSTKSNKPGKVVNLDSKNDNVITYNGVEYVKMSRFEDKSSIGLQVIDKETKEIGYITDIVDDDNFISINKMNGESDLVSKLIPKENKYYISKVRNPEIFIHNNILYKKIKNINQIKEGKQIIDKTNKKIGHISKISNGYIYIRNVEGNKYYIYMSELLRHNLYVRITKGGEMKQTPRKRWKFW